MTPSATRRSTRRLTLRREALAALSTGELAAVEGAGPAATIPALCFVYDPTRLRCTASFDC